MKKMFLFKHFFALVAGILMFWPSSSDAIVVTYLDPGYYVSDSFTFPFDAPAVAFDADRNVYTVNKHDFNTYDPTNEIPIWKFHAATNYATFEEYTTYIGGGITGLVFDRTGNLYVAEIGRKNGFLDQGRISIIDALLNQSTVVNLPEFRPTGISLDSAGTIYFPGRLGSQPTIGSLYTIDPAGGTPVELVSGFVGSGIAIDDFDNIFASTPNRDDVPGQIARTIYMFDSGSLTPSLFAQSVPTVEELAFDWEGKHLYALEVTEFSSGELNPPEMIKISPKMVVDVKPGSYPNCFNINGRGVIPVAINGGPYFDVADVDISSLEFAGLEVREKGSGAPQCGYEDWNEDSYLDLVCQFVDDPSLWETDDGIATLTGMLVGGTTIERADSICIRP